MRKPFFYGASVPSIYKNGKNEDAFRKKKLTKNYAVLAIADGLGSCSKSGLGAKVAVRSSVNKAEEIVRNQDVLSLEFIADLAFEEARKSIEDKAKLLGSQIIDFACTLILVITHKNEVLVSHLGDGAVVGIGSGNQVRLISKPLNQEYSNLVVDLASKAWKENIRFSHHKEIECVVSFSDGCQPNTISRKQGDWEPYAPFFQEIYKYSKGITSVRKANKDLKDLLKNKNKFVGDDDKTMVVGLL